MIIVKKNNNCNFNNSLQLNEEMGNEILDSKIKPNFFKIEKSLTNNNLNIVSDQKILNSKRKKKNKDKNLLKEKSIEYWSKSKNSFINEDIIFESLFLKSPFLNLIEERNSCISSNEETENNESWNGYLKIFSREN